jgi:hypothetical protein
MLVELEIAMAMDQEGGGGSLVSSKKHDNLNMSYFNETFPFFSKPMGNLKPWQKLIHCQKHRKEKKFIPFHRDLKMPINTFTVVEGKAISVDTRIGFEKEATNTAREGDFIVAGPVGEKYVILSEKLLGNYTAKDANGKLLDYTFESKASNLKTYLQQARKIVPNVASRTAIRVNKDIYAILEKKVKTYKDKGDSERPDFFRLKPYEDPTAIGMKLKLGDYIIFKDEPRPEFYRIHRDVFENDYAIVPSNANGSSTKANGPSTNANGSSTKANGSSTKANGPSTNANGSSTNANGSSTKANGPSTNANGSSTKARLHPPKTIVPPPKTIVPPPKTIVPPPKTIVHPPKTIAPPLKTIVTPLKTIVTPLKTIVTFTKANGPHIQARLHTPKTMVTSTNANANGPSTSTNAPPVKAGGSWFKSADPIAELRTKLDIAVVAENNLKELINNAISINNTNAQPVYQELRESVRKEFGAQIISISVLPVINKFDNDKTNKFYKTDVAFDKTLADVRGAVNTYVSVTKKWLSISNNMMKAAKRESGDIRVRVKEIQSAANKVNESAGAVSSKMKAAMKFMKK